MPHPNASQLEEDNVAAHQYSLLAVQFISLVVWLIGKGDTFRPPGLEPSIPPSSSHRNHGAPWEVACDNIFFTQFQERGMTSPKGLKFKILNLNQGSVKLEWFSFPLKKLLLEG